MMVTSREGYLFVHGHAVILTEIRENNRIAATSRHSGASSKQCDILYTLTYNTESRIHPSTGRAKLVSVGACKELPMRGSWGAV